MNNPTITPGILYHNAPEKIKWLCETFGFKKKTIIFGEGDTILHAHLTFENGGVMISSAEIKQPITLSKTPKDVGGIGTIEIIVYVKSIDKHYQTAKQKGAEIVLEIEDKPYGGRGYCAKDKEGYIWVFSSYNPWEG